MPRMFRFERPAAVSACASVFVHSCVSTSYIVHLYLFALLEQIRNLGRQHQRAPVVSPVEVDQ